MKNFFTLALSLILLALTAGTAWILVTLSGNVEVTHTEPGTATEIRVP
jgi:hypothetical protein